MNLVDQRRQGSGGRRAPEIAAKPGRLQPSRHVTAFNLALVSLGVGDDSRGMSYLEQAYATDSQWLRWLKGDRIFDPLRLNPRFSELMRKLRILD